MRILNFNIRPTYIEIDNGGIAFFPFFGFIRKASWSNLLEVQIETTDKGPFEEDVFFLLNFKNTSMRVEQCIASGLLSKLQALPGFNNAELIKAMSSAQNARFKLWRKS